MPKLPKANAEGLDEYGLPPLIHTEVLAHLTGVTARRLHQLISDTRIPAECNFSGDKWRTTLTLREVFGYYRRQADKTKPMSDRLLDIQQRTEDLRSTKIKNAKLARELLPRHVYAQAWGELLSVFKSRFLNMADKLAPRVFRAKDKVDVAEIIDKEVREIFTGLMDPKVMEDLAARIRDDDFDDPASTENASGDTGGPAEAARDLEPPDA